ncbi:lanthionine synthetase-like protein [Arcicella aurantiaca]|uniref:Lanthionine synthetase-like protein n=1 Tax=Arcicella aurantiaca TaxID=591202 RepID=A0A316E579_9BACT|nr:lanthionine synthetase C family protein [Arcicella aurantiaca]PWK18080.1 lanthionine synthetase-like protein [Arcicella aurantiaca]
MKTLTIEKELIDLQVKKLLNIIEVTEPKNDTLFSGRIGQILYYFYMFRYFEDEKYADKGVELIETILHNMDTHKSPYLLKPAFSYGLSGFGYVLSLLKDEGIIDINFDEQLCEFDDIVYTKTLEDVVKRNTDYLHGSLGVLLYLSRRLSNPKVEKYLEILVETLSKTAIRDSRGVRFENSHIARLNESDNINLGLAHGLCGILMILLKIHAKGICKTQIEEIVSGGINFILSYKTPQDFATGKYSFFPLTINEKEPWNSDKNIEEYGSRLGWCYGDLNEILLLYTASKQFGVPEWADIADEVGCNTIERKNRKETIVIDSHICHGSIGMAQYYKRFYEMTALPIYEEGYYYWIERTLQFLEKETTDPLFRSHAGELLEGFVGISLGLISAVSEEDLKWDSVFLLS